MALPSFQRDVDCFKPSSILIPGQALWKRCEASHQNRIFKQRNVVSASSNSPMRGPLGISGVMVRGSGAAWDPRKAQPYECYS
jgi:NADH:ubiquinone oxidoreductase subunit D